MVQRVAHIHACVRGKYLFVLLSFSLEILLAVALTLVTVILNTCIVIEVTDDPQHLQLEYLILPGIELTLVPY